MMRIMTIGKNMVSAGKSRTYIVTVGKEAFYIGPEDKRRKNKRAVVNLDEMMDHPLFTNQEYVEKRLEEEVEKVFKTKEVYLCFGEEARNMVNRIVLENYFEYASADRE